MARKADAFQQIANIVLSTAGSPPGGLDEQIGNLFLLEHERRLFVERVQHRTKEQGFQFELSRIPASPEFTLRDVALGLLAALPGDTTIPDQD